jgi:photosystem II stability/assembly factor-like uncharacterized protein
MQFHRSRANNWYTITLRALLLFICAQLALLSAGQMLEAHAQSAEIQNSKKFAISQSAPLPTRSPLEEKAASLDSLHMLTKTDGWAIANNGLQILHTTQGPQHWQNVTPVLPHLPYHFYGPDFFSSKIAWVAQEELGQIFVIFRTVDGGQHWLATTVGQGIQIMQISFIDLHSGWALFDTSADMNQESIEVLHSTDGGATWSTISVTDTTTGDRKGALPLSGDKTGLSFINSMTGWISGSSSDSQSPLYLYVTHDGGYTWNLEKLALPSSTQNALVSPPIFFNSHNGYLSIVVPTPTGLTLYVFITHNAGLSWQRTTPIAPVTPSLTFSDLEHGWVFDQNNQLRVTSNGSQSWQVIKPQTSQTFQNPGSLDFISNHVGWLLYFESRTGTNQLFQTLDGGKSWTALSTGMV